MKIINENYLLIGQKNYNNQNCLMTIINIINRKNIDVKFDDGTVITNKYYKSFLTGEIKNPNHPSVYGVGFIGIGEHNHISKCGMQIIYQFWIRMLERCYNQNYKNKTPTYNECTVCKEWHNFQTFAKWVDKNYYAIKNTKMQLDKDILIKGNKIYSPETCCFVPQEINNLFLKRKNDRGSCVIGVWLEKSTGKYISSVSIRNNKRKFLGRFSNEIDAFYAYKNEKEKYIKNIAELYKNKIPVKLYNALYEYEVNIDD